MCPLWFTAQSSILQLFRAPGDSSLALAVPLRGGALSRSAAGSTKESRRARESYIGAARLSFREPAAGRGASSARREASRLWQGAPVKTDRLQKRCSPRNQQRHPRAGGDPARLQSRRTSLTDVRYKFGWILACAGMTEGHGQHVQVPAFKSDAARTTNNVIPAQAGIRPGFN